MDKQKVELRLFGFGYAEEEVFHGNKNRKIQRNMVMKIAVEISCLKCLSECTAGTRGASD